jgi:uncharacterized cupin superfamily protein
MTTRRHPNVINIDELEPRVNETGTKMGARQRQLAGPTGGKGLGCMHYEVAPGRAAFPKHFHCATEEALFVLEGEGVLRIGEHDEVTLRAGDYVAFPCGPGSAHQVVNRSTTTLKYLCVSTKVEADVVVYPDSKKFAVAATNDPRAWATGNFWIREIRSLVDGRMEYFDGEDVG